MDSVFRFMPDFKLAPRDSFHIAKCFYEETKYFVTWDRDFLSIPSDYEDIDLGLIEF